MSMFISVSLRVCAWRPNSPCLSWSTLADIILPSMFNCIFCSSVKKVSLKIQMASLLKRLYAEMVKLLHCFSGFVDFHQAFLSDIFWKQTAFSADIQCSIQNQKKRKCWKCEIGIVPLIVQYFKRNPQKSPNLLQGDKIRATPRRADEAGFGTSWAARR